MRKFLLLSLFITQWGYAEEAAVCPKETRLYDFCGVLYTDFRSEAPKKNEEAFKNCNEAADPKVKQCEVLVKMYSGAMGKDFKASDIAKTSGTRYANPQNFANNFECESGTGVVDYDNCRDLVMSLSAAIISEQGTKIAGDVRQISSQTNIQKNFRENGADQDKLIAAAKTTTLTAKENAEMRGTAFAANAANISRIISDFDTAKKAKKKCVNKAEVDESLCETVFSDESVRSALFKNGDALNAAKGALVEQMGKLAVSTAEMIALKKQLNALDGVSTDLEKLKNPDQQNLEDLTVQLCVANPTHPQCANQGQSVVALPDDAGYSLSFGSGNNTITQGANGFEPTNNTPVATNDQGNPNDLGPLGIGGGDSGVTDSMLTPDGSGSVKFADGPSGGGGGGGGGAGGGGSGGVALGGGGAGGGAGFNGLATNKSGATIGSSGLNFNRSDKSSKKEDPLAGLFDKKDNKGSNVDFRAPASEMGDTSKSLFVRITEGYQKAQNQKRLLEYEIK